MEKEKLEVESSEEDDKVLPEKKEEIKSEEEGTEVADEEKEKTEDEFEKKEEFVSTNKFNQAVRKQRELELEKRELEKKLSEKEGSTVTSEKVKPAPKKREEDAFFEDIEDEEKVEKEKEVPSEIDTAKMLDEKLKPVFDTLKRREEEDRKKNRIAFFEAHPEYQYDSEKWNGLLDVLDKDINPNTSDDYISQLNKAHILYTGQTSENIEVASKKKEMASDAASGSGEAVKAIAKEEFTAEDRKYMKEWNISEDGMRAAKAKLKSGDMRILT